MSEIIYLESDAEITEAIDKLKSAKKDEVKLVVPARSGLLQSVVNLKLLKKAAKDHGRELILVTNDKTAKYLAGGVGLAVAVNLKAEAKIPEQVREDAKPDIVEPEKVEPIEEAESSKPIEKHEEPKVSSRALTDDEPIEQPKAKAKDSKKGPKVPNFNQLQKRIWIAAGVGIGIILLIVLATVLPSAEVVLNVKAKKLPVDTKFIVDTTSTKSDFPNRVIAGTKLQNDKDLTGNFTATGKKDVGTKASGSANIVNCEDTNSHPLPAGSKLTTSGKTFLTNSAATIPAGQFSNGGATCSSNPITVNITAAESGDSYNLGNAQFAVVGLSNKVSGTGSTSGGTSKQVTIVTQGDIDKAKSDMLEQGKDQQKSDLVAKAGKDAKAFEETFAINVVSFSSSVAADSENSNGSVSAKVSYTMLAANNSEVSGLVDAVIKGDVPAGSQVYDNGLGDAKYTFIKAVGDGRAQIQATGKAYYGLPLDTKKIASDLKNKPKKEVNSIVTKNPDITGSQVNSWPPLFPNMPALDSNIHIKLKVTQD